LFDGALLIALDAVVIVLTLRLSGLDMRSLGALPIAPLAAFLMLLNLGYVVVLTLVGGQTFGKMACGVRVVAQGGGPMTAAVSIMRGLGYLISLLPLGLGIAWMFLDSEHRALHDRLAGTRVLMASK
jgi:uncharacterized RDD family membrane protein YckC